MPRKNRQPARTTQLAAVPGRLTEIALPPRRQDPRAVPPPPAPPPQLTPDDLTVLRQYADALEHQRRANRFRDELDRLVWAFPSKKVSDTERYWVKSLLTQVYVSCWGELVDRKIPSERAARLAWRYIGALRPRTFRSLLKVARGTPRRGAIQMFRPFYKAVVYPAVKQALQALGVSRGERPNSEQLEALAHAVRQHLADHGRRTPRDMEASLARSAASEWKTPGEGPTSYVTPDLFHDSGQLRRPSDIALALTARVLTLGSSPGKTQFERLWRQASRPSWRVPEWETPEALAVVRQILTAK